VTTGVKSAATVAAFATTTTTTITVALPACLQERFDLLAASKITKVGLWRAPVPDNWWPFLDAL